MSAQASSAAENGDVIYGKKTENSVWPVVIVGVVILAAVVALAAVFSREKK